MNIRFKVLGSLLALVSLGVAAVGCGSEAETLIQRVVETVVVEKQVAGETVTEIREVIVEKEVVVEKPVVKEVEKEVIVEKVVIETVVVEKQVAGKTVTEVKEVIKEVVVEKPVVQEVIVEKEVVVEKVVEVVATRAPDAPVPSTWGGTLVLAAHGPGNHFDPITGGSVSVMGVMSPMYNKLVRHIGVTPALPIVGDLAQSWNLSPDGLIYTFNLRRGVKFHDGSDFDADDVKASFERIINPPEGLVANAGGNFKSVSQINVIDKYTVEFVADAPDVPIEAFAHGGAIIVSADDIAAHNGDFREHKWAIGTGPFTSVERNDELWLQERFTDYFKPGQPHPDFLKHIWLVYQTPQNDAALRSGITDWAAWITPKLGKQLNAGEGPPGLMGYGWIFPVVGTYLFQSNDHSPLSDKNIRKAFALVIDQNDIFEALKDVEAHEPGGFLPIGTRHAKPIAELMTIPGVRPMTDEDLATAQQLLKDAGYEGGEGFPEVELLSRDAPSERIANEAIQAMLKQHLGIEATIKLVDSSEHTNVLNSNEWDMATLGPYSTGLADPVGILKSGYYCVDGKNLSGLEPRGGWCNAEMQTLIADMALTKPGSGARQALVDRVNEILYDEWPRMPVGPFPQYWGHWDYLGGNLPRAKFSGHYVLFTWDDVWLNQPARRAETR